MGSLADPEGLAVGCMRSLGRNVSSTTATKERDHVVPRRIGGAVFQTPTLSRVGAVVTVRGRYAWAKKAGYRRMRCLRGPKRRKKKRRRRLVTELGEEPIEPDPEPAAAEEPAEPEPAPQLSPGPVEPAPELDAADASAPAAADNAAPAVPSRARKTQQRSGGGGGYRAYLREEHKQSGKQAKKDISSALSFFLRSCMNSLKKQNANLGTAKSAARKRPQTDLMRSVKVPAAPGFIPSPSPRSPPAKMTSFLQPRSTPTSLLLVPAKMSSS